MNKTDINKLKTYKRLNAPATIFGFPYGIFFIVLIWIISILFLFMSVPFFTGVIILIIGVLGLFGLIIVYKKYGIKSISKKYNLYFNNIEVVKINENVIIPIKKLKSNL